MKRRKVRKLMGVGTTPPLAAALAISAWGAALGVHGLYVYSRGYIGLAASADTEGTFISKLFHVIPVGQQLGDTVKWMTTEGLISWFTPIVILIASLVATGILWGKLTNR